MIVVLTLVMIGILWVLVSLHRVVNRMVKVSAEQVAETRALRLDSRARIGQASVRSGVVDEEFKLQRLGRATAGRRIVVGGDPDSEQHQRVARQVASNRGWTGGEGE